MTNSRRDVVLTVDDVDIRSRLNLAPQRKPEMPEGSPLNTAGYPCALAAIRLRVVRFRTAIPQLRTRNMCVIPGPGKSLDPPAIEIFRSNSDTMAVRLME